MTKGFMIGSSDLVCCYPSSPALQHCMRARKPNSGSTVAALSSPSQLRPAWAWLSWPQRDSLSKTSLISPWELRLAQWHHRAAGFPRLELSPLQWYANVATCLENPCPREASRQKLEPWRKWIDFPMVMLRNATGPAPDQWFRWLGFPEPQPSRNREKMLRGWGFSATDTCVLWQRGVRSSDRCFVGRHWRPCGTLCGTWGIRGGYCCVRGTSEFQ